LLREIGKHPEGGTIGVYRGRYGPYVSHDGVIASLPKGADPNSYPLEAAIEVLAAQKAKGKGRRSARKAKAAPNGEAKPARRTAAKRTPPKRAAAKATATPARSTAKRAASARKSKAKPAARKKPPARGAARLADG
jgi:DNA topoisomerase-1